MYSYCANDPVNLIDPTGNYTDSDGNSHYEDPVGSSGPVYAQPAHGSSGSSNGPNPSPTITTKYYKDGSIKSVGIQDGNETTTYHFNKDGTLSYVATRDSNSGISTLTYYHKDGTISTTTFGQTGEMIGYSKTVDLSYLSWIDENGNLVNGNDIIQANLSNDLGKEFEELLSSILNLAKNKEIMNGRIVDFYDIVKKIAWEAKNRAYLCMSSQLRDFIKMFPSFNLVISERTEKVAMTVYDALLNARKLGSNVKMFRVVDGALREIDLQKTVDTGKEVFKTVGLGLASRLGTLIQVLSSAPIIIVDPRSQYGIPDYSKREI